jgi:hypothetical protein
VVVRRSRGGGERNEKRKEKVKRNEKSTHQRTRRLLGQLPPETVFEIGEALARPGLSFVRRDPVDERARVVLDELEVGRVWVIGGVGVGARARQRGDDHRLAVLGHRKVDDVGAG